MRTISLLLSLVMLLGMLSGCGGNTEPSNPTENLSSESALEIQAAIDLGLIPEELQKDYDKQIKYNEFVPLITNIIALRYGEGSNDHSYRLYWNILPEGGR